MTTTTVLFLIFSAVMLLAGLRVVTARNPVHAVLFLVLAFFSAACLWMLLRAEFLAIVLVLVYVGAVMVLFLFVVMMLDVNVAAEREGFTRYAPIGAIVAGVMVLELLSLVWVKTSGLPVALPLATQGADHSNTEEIGAAPYLAIPEQNAAERQIERFEEGASLEEIYAEQIGATETIGG